MQFGAWISLDAAVALKLGAVPPSPGVFQLRIEQGLLDYPRGKSAMVAYGAGPDVRRALSDFLRSDGGSRARALGRLLLRWAVPDPGKDPLAALERLHQRFNEQFGSLPLAECPPQPPEPEPQQS